MYSIDLSGKTAVIFGIANQRSIAWSIAKILHKAGATIFAAYQNERVKDNVVKLTSQLSDIQLIECDVSEEKNKPLVLINPLLEEIIKPALPASPPEPLLIIMPGI